MASISFILKGKSNLSQLYIRVKDGRAIDITHKTDLLLCPQNWSIKKGRVKQTATFQEKFTLISKLNELHNYITNSIIEEKCQSNILTKEWLKASIDIFHGRNIIQSDGFIELIKLKKHALETGLKKVSPSTINTYNTTIARLEKYQKVKEKILTVLDIDLNFHNDYIIFARDVLKLSINSINIDIKKIKTVCNDAKAKGIQINEQAISRKFTSPTEKTIFITLTEKEINLIKNYNGPEHLENARDWLIIGCWTGCRVNDLIKLDTNNLIVTIQGVKHINYTQNKTQKTVHIPLHPDVIDILVQKNGFPREISDVKFNKYIKVVCQSVGINEMVYGSKSNEVTLRKETGYFEKYKLVRSHTCRRTFATIHYSKLPNKTIMAVTGHTQEKQFLEYIGQQENTHLNDFIELWNK